MKNTFLSLIALVFLPLTAFAQTQLDAVQAVFDVEYNNKATQGEHHLRIEQKNHHYTVQFALAHWMIASNQRANFHLDPTSCKVQPQHYGSTSKQPFKNTTTQHIQFDWSKLQAVFTDNSTDEATRFKLNPKQPLYDPLSFFFEARCELMAGHTEFSYPLIYKGKQRTHHYHVVGEEQVNTGLGTINALIVERKRSSKNRQTRLYVAPELDYLLVKIEHQESRLLRVVATLKKMDYRTLSH